MKELCMMIDYTDKATGKITRNRIDDAAISVRDGVCYFTVDGQNIEVDLDDVFQIYTN